MIVMVSTEITVQHRNTLLGGELGERESGFSCFRAVIPTWEILLCGARQSYERIKPVSLCTYRWIMGLHNAVGILALLGNCFSGLETR